ncbi:AAA family ATPase [Neolewinella sp.]|uniref:AAA family ATPase n=1 Tax=Neolewinella sp. TaxID=2993543 RepID=UPI003B528125
MLIRLVVNNFLSFGEEREFNMLPNERYKKLPHHTYSVGSESVLKLAAVYGANAAGKSNLVKALEVLKSFVNQKKIPIDIGINRFRFDEALQDGAVALAVEFWAREKAFVYGVEFCDDFVLTEELYESGLGIRDDRLVFRKYVQDGKTQIEFSKGFSRSKKNQLLESVLEDNLLKDDESALRFLATLKVPELADVELAAHWFDQTLQIITPSEIARGLPHFLDINSQLAEYANQLMRTYHLGVAAVEIERLSLDEFVGRDNPSASRSIMQDLADSHHNFITLKSGKGDIVCAVQEDDKIVVKRLRIRHTTPSGKERVFEMGEESDGTKRLLDFVLTFFAVVRQGTVFVIDEIERSLHPNLIKQLIHKFSHDDRTNGQLIFTTHESNLLDQNILRRDEIWFAEKDSFGSTDLYSLSKFREHHTMDIRKGYLTGRYGGIPFTGNLEELNWHDYDLV